MFSTRVCLYYLPEPLHISISLLLQADSFCLPCLLPLWLGLEMDFFLSFSFSLCRTARLFFPEPFSLSFSLPPPCIVTDFCGRPDFSRQKVIFAFYGVHKRKREKNRSQEAPPRCLFMCIKVLVKQERRSGVYPPCPSFIFFGHRWTPDQFWALYAFWRHEFEPLTSNNRSELYC